MMKTTQIKWYDYQQLLTSSKLFTVLLLLLCCKTTFGQVYISEGTTLIVENKVFIGEKSETAIAQDFSEIYIATDSLRLAVQTKVTESSQIKTKKKNNVKPEVKKNKIAKVPSFNFSSSPEQHLTAIKKYGSFAMVPIHNPALLAPFQTVVHTEKNFTFFGKSLSEKLSEQFKNRPLYSCSAIRPPPSEEILAM